MRNRLPCCLLLLSVHTLLLIIFYICRCSLNNGTKTSLLPRLHQQYPARQHMGSCPKLYGDVTVFIVYVKSSMKTHYSVAQKTLHCYLKSVDYKFIAVDLDRDRRVKNACTHDQLFFKKHCAAAQYLEDTDWMLVLDADTGVVNPNHCIEEWIDPRVDIVFYERAFNWEIASGNYLIKNTPFAKKFLMDWADWQYKQPSNWNGADNGVLQMHIMQTVLPDAVQESKNCDRIWRQGRNYETYMAFVTCVKVYLGARRLWPGKLRILRRLHGWVRDWFLTSDRWCDRDFMMHGWKKQNIHADGWPSPFEEVPDPSKCGRSTTGWHWRSLSHVTVEEMSKLLRTFESYSAANHPKEARLLPYLEQPDIGECYPNCDNLTSLLLPE